MTTFISDLHLGTKRTKVERLLTFLNRIDKRQELHLVGDIFDDLAPNKWPKDHAEVVRVLMRFETLVVYPGNHDAFLENLTGYFFALRNIQFQRERLYYATNGKGYLVTHGHQHDLTIKCQPPLPKPILRGLSRLFCQAHVGPLASRIERGTTAEAKRIKTTAYHGTPLAGVICGHTHKPAQKIVNGVEYWNCGDWVRHCTAIVDDGNGLQLVKG